MSQTFKAGDLVQLKSGGPKMVIEKSADFEVGAWECSWFAGAKNNTRNFQEAALKIWEENGNDP